MHVLHQHKILITEQEVVESNLIYELANMKQILPHDQ